MWVRYSWSSMSFVGVCGIDVAFWDDPPLLVWAGQVVDEGEDLPWLMVVVGRSGIAFSSGCGGSVFGGIEVCMVVMGIKVGAAMKDIGEVGSKMWCLLEVLPADLVMFWVVGHVLA